MLGERPLAEQEAANLAARPVLGGAALGRIEAMDRRLDALGRLADADLGRVEPALRGDVEAAGRRVDGVGVGHQRVGVDRGQAALEVDGEHGDHVDAAEAGCAAHRAAGDEPMGALAPGRPAGQHTAGQPFGRTRAAHGRDGAQEGARRPAQHDPRGLAGEARAHVAALDVERVDPAQPTGIRHVDLDQARSRHPLREPEDLALGVERGDDEHTVAAQQQRVLCAVGQLQRVDHYRGRGPHVDGVHGVAGDDERMRAVRLDDVGLVDALLLHVGAREVVAGRAFLLTSCRAVVLPAAVEDQRSCVAHRVAAGVAHEAGAGAERRQPDLARAGLLHSARLAACRDGDQRGGEDGGEQCAKQHRRASVATAGRDG